MESSNQPMTFRMEIMDKIKVPYDGTPISMATMNEDFYLLYCSRAGDRINVFNRSNLREVKHVIYTRVYKFDPRAIVACNTASCVYVLSLRWEKGKTSSVERITKDDDHQFVVSPWISGLSVFSPIDTYNISVTPDGRLILSRTEGADEILSIYGVDGSLHQQIRLCLDLFCVSRIIPKSNGNLVFVSLNGEFKKQLTETDLEGNVVKKYESSLLAPDADYADCKDRFLIIDVDNRMELLDSQFNPLHVVTRPRETSDKLWKYLKFLHFDKLRNEVLVLDYQLGFCEPTITIINFREE